MGSVFDGIFEFFTGSEEAKKVETVRQSAHNEVTSAKSKAKALKESRERNAGGLQSAKITSPLDAGSSVSGGVTGTQLLNPLQK